MPPARKTTPKKATATTGGEPLLELFTEDDDAEQVLMEDAFSLNGRVFQVPAEVDAAVAIRYLDHCRHKGENWALSWLLEEVLGTASYEALLTVKNLKEKQLLAIARIVQSKAIGDSGPKGSQHP